MQRKARPPGFCGELGRGVLRGWLLPDAGCEDRAAGRCPSRGAEWRCEGLSSHGRYERRPRRSAIAPHNERRGRPADPGLCSWGRSFARRGTTSLAGFPLLLERGRSVL